MPPTSKRARSKGSGSAHGNDAPEASGGGGAAAPAPSFARRGGRVRKPRFDLAKLAAEDIGAGDDDHDDADDGDGSDAKKVAPPKRKRGGKRASKSMISPGNKKRCALNPGDTALQMVRYPHATTKCLHVSYICCLLHTYVPVVVLWTGAVL